MKSLLESLSLGSGAVVVAILSAILAWPLSGLRSIVLRWVSCTGAALLLANALYWAPVWLGSDDLAQFSSWQSLVIGIWFLVGVASSAMVLFARWNRTSTARNQDLDD